MPAFTEHSEADSDDVLEALIQSELAQFHIQQAQRYAALASEGHTYIPLASPAPQQQQLRAQQRQQDALIGGVDLNLDMCSLSTAATSDIAIVPAFSSEVHVCLPGYTS